MNSSNPSREEAVALVKQHIKQANLFKHCLALEAVLRALARRLGEDEQVWAMAGLVHDIDYEETANDPERHTQVGAEILREHGFDEAVIHACLAHCDKAPRESLLDKAIWAADPLTGLIVAAALIRPEKRLAAVDAQFVVNRFGDRSFARSANRSQIASCEELGLTLDEFVGLGLSAMQEIAGELGL